MNKIDFLKYTTFPLDSNTLAFMQEMIQTVTKMSAVCGEKVIVSGCKVSGNMIGDGLVIVNGELLEFKGDVRVDKVYIEETGEQVVCLEEAFDDLYIHRCVKFGNGDGVNNFPWADFKRLDDIPALMNKIASLQSGKSNVGHTHAIADVTNLPVSVVPKGLIAMWSGTITTIPTGWALCDGRYVNGSPIPDLRGKFIVGYNFGDSDYDSIGKEGGQKQVTLSINQIPSHNHTTGTAGSISGGDWGLIRCSKTGEGKTIHSGDSGGAGKEPDLYTTPDRIPYQGGGTGHENRPPYYVLAYIIKL